MKNLLLTGATGLIGSNALRHYLVNTDWHITMPSTGRHKGNSDRIAVAVGEWCDRHEKCKPIDGWRERVTFTHTDLAQPIQESTVKKWGQVDYVLNLASLSHVPDSVTDPANFARNNFELMLSMLEYARETDPEIFIQCSTDETMGPVEPGYGHKEWAPTRPSQSYSASKAAQEALCYAWYRSYDLRLSITNCMNLYAPTQGQKFTDIIIRKVMRSETVDIHVDENGEPGSRYYLHARNLADAWMWMIQTDQTWRYLSHGGDPQRFHIAGERDIDNLEWAQMIAEMVGKPLKWRPVNFHQGSHGASHDIRYGLDSSKIHNEGWKMPISLEQSLQETVEWTLDHPEWF